MSAPSWEDVRVLLTRSGDGHVSVSLPTHRGGRETEQDRIRLKNLLRTAEEELGRLGLRGPDASAVLEPGLRVLDDAGFWRERRDGLALFLAPGWSRIWWAPVSLEESVATGTRFRIRPLLPALWPDLRFRVLALSRHAARLLDATRFTVREVDVPQMPDGVDGLPGEIETGRHLQTHVAARRGESRAGGALAFHGHGLPRDAEDDRLLEYFRAVDGSVTDAAGTDGAPLVLAAVEHFVPLYREVATHPWVLEDAVTGNPDGLPNEELQRRAWELVAPLVERETDERLARYHERAARGDAVHGLVNALRSARAARVDTLFLSEEDAVWGRYDVENDKARVHDERRPGDEDLLDRAAAETIKTGGAVLSLPRRRMPVPEPVAALLRY
jgi:hypothetical protein